MLVDWYALDYSAFGSIATQDLCANTYLKEWKNAKLLYLVEHYGYDACRKFEKNFRLVEAEKKGKAKAAAKQKAKTIRQSVKKTMKAKSESVKPIIKKMARKLSENYMPMDIALATSVHLIETELALKRFKRGISTLELVSAATNVIRM